MHELFVLDEILPVAPGQSPTRVRGVVYGRAVEHAKTIAGDLKEFARHLPDERVQRFIQQPFKFNALYDAFPILPVQIALSRLQNRDFEAATRARAAEGALRLIPRMFRLILGFARPSTWALHAPRLMGEYCGYGNIRLSKATDTSAVFEMFDVPQFVAASHANTVIGIFEGSLSMLRALNVTSRYTEVALCGAQDGFALLRYKIELDWK